MDKIKEIEDKFFDLGNYDSLAIRRFVKKSIEADDAEASKVINLKVQSVVNREEAFKLLSDNGTGRIFLGAMSLELIARTANGIPASSLVLFDYKILFNNIAELKSANQETARMIVLRNLGVIPYYESVKDTGDALVAEYNAMLDRVVRKVKSGGFRASDSLTEILAKTKDLIRYALIVSEKGINRVEGL